MKVASIGIKTSRSVRRGDRTSFIGIASNISRVCAVYAHAAAADLADDLEIAQAAVLRFVSLGHRGNSWEARQKNPGRQYEDRGPLSMVYAETRVSGPYAPCKLAGPRSN